MSTGIYTEINFNDLLLMIGIFIVFFSGRYLYLKSKKFDNENKLRNNGDDDFMDRLINQSTHESINQNK